MTNPQLVNLINHAPFFTYKSGAIGIKAYTAQDIYIGGKYIARNFNYFEKGGSSVLYIMVKIDTEEKDFIFSVPHLDKRFVKEWTKEQWIKLVYLLHRKDKVSTDLEEIEAALSNMKYFSDMRKLAKNKKTELRKDLKSVERNIQQFLTNAREKGNERIVFRD